LRWSAGTRGGLPFGARMRSSARRPSPALAPLPLRGSGLA
jgi:hypothetical protein